jgi:predicted small secreted protein
MRNRLRELKLAWIGIVLLALPIVVAACNQKGGTGY